MEVMTKNVTNKKCPVVVGRAARYVREILVKWD